MRKFFLGFLVLLTLAVASCGGGGGYDGNPTPTNALRMSPLLSNVSLPVGYVAEVAQISQGVAPYHVLSSDASVGVEDIIPEDGVLRVAGLKPGTSTVVVQDSSVRQTQISLTVTVKVNPLATSVGTALTLRVGEPRTFAISGGVGPYTVISNDNSIAEVSGQNNSVITVTGKTKGTVPVLITDSTGATLTVTLTVAVDDFKVNPASPTGQVGSEMTLAIVGGVAPYTAVSSTPSVVTVQVNGDAARVAFKSEGMSTLTFRDSSGLSIPVTATSTLTVPPLVISPSSGSAQAGTRLTFTVVSGAGPYTVVSSNPSVASASVSGSTVSVSLLTAGNSTITVMDSRGQFAPITVTSTPVPPPPAEFTATPSNQTVASEELTPVTYQITGGVGPFVALVNASDLAIASASVSGTTLSVRVGSSGTRCVASQRNVQVMVTDTGTGNMITVTQTIAAKLPSGSICP
ncbi:hypothetical protein [Ottowia thiooxydans]|uniref:BIG2 domain-containing protein n=1 Tax=Ottowia thiooxydans TaxID=219182 RepID=A0ABV2QB02_9BURK